MDNIADAFSKRRLRHGEKSNTCKLSKEQVREIVQRYKPGIVTQAQLAKEYGVGRIEVLRIVHGLRWKHLELDTKEGDMREASNKVKHLQNR